MEEKIFDFIQKIAEKKGDTITKDTNLYEEGIIDSLEILSLLSFIQEEFGISFTPDDLKFENFDSVNSILEWLKGSIA